MTITNVTITIVTCGPPRGLKPRPTQPHLPLLPSHSGAVMDASQSDRIKRSTAVRTHSPHRKGHRASNPGPLRPVMSRFPPPRLGQPYMFPGGHIRGDVMTWQNSFPLHEARRSSVFEVQCLSLVCYRIKANQFKFHLSEVDGGRCGGRKGRAAQAVRSPSP